PDLLLQAVREFDANSDGAAGDFIGPDGLIDAAKFDAQGHRGARNLRPENTLPAMEAALDNLMTTLETDNGVSSNGVAILNHDPKIEAAKCRNADGTPYTAVDEVFIKNLTAAQIQSRFICDKVFRGPEQQNDPALSPASIAFAAARGLMHPYVMPTTQQLFDFAEFYIAYYSTGGPGTAHADAGKRKANAERVRYNIETKINPRAEFAARTIAAEPFAAAVAGVIAANRLESKADIQSFDFRTLLEVHKTFPAIRTVFLFGDFPIFADRSIEGSDDGTNLQDENGANTPWLAGLFWPYRATADSAPFKVARSGGFEGMALSTDGKKLYPLLEAPLVGATTSDAKTLLIHEFNLDRNVYTGKRFKYALDAGGTNIGDFILYNRKEGLVIERDGSQGKLDGFKKIYKIQLNDPEGFVGKEELVDLLAIKDRARISEPGQPGDVGLGKKFAFPFVTIEDVVVLNSKTLGVINDNNYPFSVGRHVGSGEPDDTEFIQIRLDERLDLDDKH
ncbi:MAG: esterase-like activity of phytase family protein, partial [Burkholderiales bacterium]|nr:esterase-like activity of phytase family protein [Burkholderiales bacterium]